MSDTPRGSWATFDLRQTASDPLLPGLLDRLAPDVVDNVNKLRRSELQLVSCFILAKQKHFQLSSMHYFFLQTQDTLFALYPPQDDEEKEV